MMILQVDEGRDVEYIDFILGLLSGAVLTLITQIVGHYFSRKNLKTQQEHSERILKMQLFHKDRKKALIELDEILKKGYKTFRDFSSSVESFLDGSSGIFIPTRLGDELKNEINKIWSLIYGTGIPEPEPEEFDYESWAKAFPEEALGYEITDRMHRLKGSMRDKIKKYISEA